MIEPSATVTQSQQFTGSLGVFMTKAMQAVFPSPTISSIESCDAGLRHRLNDLEVSLAPFDSAEGAHVYEVVGKGKGRGSKSVPGLDPLPGEALRLA